MMWWKWFLSVLTLQRQGRNWNSNSWATHSRNFQTYKYLKSCSHRIWDNAFLMNYVRRSLLTSASQDCFKPFPSQSQCYHDSSNICSTWNRSFSNFHHELVEIWLLDCSGSHLWASFICQTGEDDKQAPEDHPRAMATFLDHKRECGRQGVSGRASRESHNVLAES